MVKLTIGSFESMVPRCGAFIKLKPRSLRNQYLSFFSETIKSVKTTKSELLFEDQDDILNNLELRSALDRLEVPEQSNTPIDDFNINPLTKETLKRSGFTHLFPIQTNTFNPVINGFDVIARDRTGSGKTLAFALPILERLRKQGLITQSQTRATPFVLIIAPTRELAKQITSELNKLKNFDKEYSVVTIYGGASMAEQIHDLRIGAEIVVGTPGRIKGLIEKNLLQINNIRTLVLDETDTMLDIGFQKDIDDIISEVRNGIAKERNPKDLQFLLFSATVPKWVQSVSQKYLKPDYKFVDNIKDRDTKASTTVSHLSLHIKNDKIKVNLVKDLIVKYVGLKGRCIVFTDTKLEATRITRQIAPDVLCKELHGDIEQIDREATLKEFREGIIQCLIATDVAARGLDISNVDLVIQLSPPPNTNNYIHRSGRTGRAGKAGTCIVLYNNAEAARISRIEIEADLQFQRIGPPQPAELIKISLQKVESQLKEMNSKELTHLSYMANKLIKLFGEEQAIQKLLLATFGLDTMETSRSLMTSAKGFTAYIIEMPLYTNNKSEIQENLAEYLVNFPTSALGEVQILENKEGIAIDIKENIAAQVIAHISESTGFKIYKLDSHPSFNSRIDQSKISGLINPRNLEQEKKTFLDTFDNDKDTQNVEYGLYLLNIPDETSHAEIRQALAKHNIRVRRLNFNNGTNQINDKFAYVELESQNQAEKAFNVFKNEPVHGVLLQVDYAFNV